MSYISDWLASDGSEEAYRDFKMAAAEENARDRWEREQEDLVIDDDEDYPLGFNPYQE